MLCDPLLHLSPAPHRLPASLPTSLSLSLCLPFSISSTFADLFSLVYISLSLLKLLEKFLVRYTFPRAEIVLSRKSCSSLPLLFPPSWLCVTTRANTKVWRELCTSITRVARIRVIHTLPLEKKLFLRKRWWVMGTVLWISRGLAHYSVSDISLSLSLSISKRVSFHTPRNKLLYLKSLITARIRFLRYTAMRIFPELSQKRPHSDFFLPSGKMLPLFFIIILLYIF